jgi:hypothetical protein
VVTNHLIDVVDKNRARGVSYFMLFRHDGNSEEEKRSLEGQPVILGQYENDYVETDKGWRFKNRKATCTFVCNK